MIIRYPSQKRKTVFTNIDREATLTSLEHFMLNNSSSYAHYGLDSNSILNLVSAYLLSKYSFGGCLYEQKRGLAMGNRLAPLLAVVHMGYLESKAVFCNLILYVRYIDDVLVIVNSQDELQRLFDFLKSLDPLISFSREDPSDVGLP